MTEYTPELLTIDNYEFIIKTTSDLFDGFALVGGEPILFNDLLHIAYLINHYKGRPSHLTTNATVSLKEVKEHIHLFERINLSVNTLNPETYKTITGSEFSIDMLRYNASLLKDSDVEIKINTVLLYPYNTSEDEIIAVIEFASEFDFIPEFLYYLSLKPEDKEKVAISLRQFRQLMEKLGYNETYSPRLYNHTKNSLSS